MLLALTSAFERTQPLLSIGPTVWTNVEAMLWLCLALWALSCLAGRRWPHLPHALAVPVLAWLGVLVLSALAAPSHRADALKFVGRMVSGALVGWAAYDLARTFGRWRSLIRALALGGMVVAVLGLAEYAGIGPVEGLLQGFKQHPTFAPTVLGDILRVSSTLVYATVASMVLELAVPLLLGWTLTARRRWARLVLAAGLLVTLIAQVLTLTRGGVLALLAALALMIAWAARHRQRALLLGTLATMAALLVVVAVLLIRNPLARLRVVSEAQRRWYHATYTAPLQLSAQAGATITVPLTLRNSGSQTWLATASGPFRVGYHLTRPDGSPVSFNGRRTPLPRDVPPGSSVDVAALLTAPPTEGEYIVAWDMVQEGVTWFQWNGTPPAVTQLTVTAAGSAAQPSAPVDPASMLLTATAGEQLDRLRLWQIGAEMVQDRPLLGVGPDNFRWRYGAFAGLDRWNTDIHANNMYIEWWVGTGLVGLAAFLWWTWRLARTVCRRLQRSAVGRGHEARPEAVVWRLALAGSLFAWFSHGLVDSFYEFTPTYVAFWLIAGLAVADIGGRHREHDDAHRL